MTDESYPHPRELVSRKQAQHYKSASGFVRVGGNVNVADERYIVTCRTASYGEQDAVNAVEAADNFWRLFVLGGYSVFVWDRINNEGYLFNVGPDWIVEQMREQPSTVKTPVSTALHKLRFDESPHQNPRFKYPHPNKLIERVQATRQVNASRFARMGGRLVNPTYPYDRFVVTSESAYDDDGAANAVEAADNHWQLFLEGGCNVLVYDQYHNEGYVFNVGPNWLTEQMGER